ncbi:MAG: ROK family protein [Gammaproteobacteria bacterium]|nr:ROK family protein [Gammaproteobacteria bacterium]
MSTSTLRMGIDLGGTKIAGLVLDADGAEVCRERLPTPQGDYQLILRALAGLVASLEDKAGQQCSVGIGMPGSTSRATGLIKNSNSVCLNGQPMHRDLEALLDRPVRFANDADCFALSEATDGAAADADVVFGVIIGTGTGGGLVVNQQLVSGPNGITGEWGHNPLPWPQPEELSGPACYCGRYGCIETWLSGPGLARDHQQAYGVALEAVAVVQRAELGDTQAAATMQRYVDRLVRALASVINIIDPDVIVLGGGVSNFKRLYEAVPSRWGEYVFSDSVATRLVAAQHGAASGVRGAARLWPL